MWIILNYNVERRQDLEKKGGIKMKKYMLIIKDEDGEGALFFDDRERAEQTRMDAECGMGAYAEMYERDTDEDGIESYQFVY